MKCHYKYLKLCIFSPLTLYFDMSLSGSRPNNIDGATHVSSRVILEGVVNGQCVYVFVHCDAVVTTRVQQLTILVPV